MRVGPALFKPGGRKRCLGKVVFTITIYCLIFVALFIGVLRVPAIAMAGILLMFGLEQWAQSSSSFFVVHNTLTNYLVGALVLLAIFLKLLKGESVVANYPLVGWLVLCLFLYALTSVVWSSASETGFDLWRMNFPYIVVIILLSPLLFSTVEDLTHAFKTLIIIGTLMITLLLFKSGWTYRGVELIGVGGKRLMGNPLAVAEMGGYVMLAAAFWQPTWGDRLWVLLRWLVMVLGMALAVKSGSRGQFLGMMIAFVGFYVLSGSRRGVVHYFLLISGIVLFGAIGFWTFDSFSAAGDARWGSALIEHDVFGRWAGALKLLKAWFSSPLAIMLGLGNSASYDPKLLGIYPHIVPLEILGEEGLIGFALFASICCLTVWNLFRAISLSRAEKHHFGTVLSVGAIAFFLFILSFKQGNMLGSLPLFASAIYLGKLKNILQSQTVKECEQL